MAAIALDTTGSSVIPVGEGLEPLDDYYLWCDHRAFAEAEEITRRRMRWASKRSTGAAGCTRPSGALRSCCTGCGTILKSGHKFVTALEHCDMVAATLCGITTVERTEAQRLRDGPQVDVESEVGGLPPEEFLVAVDPLFAGVRAKLGGEYLTSDQLAGHFAEVGGGAGTAGGDSDSGGRV